VNRVLVECRDLFFRGKTQEIMHSQGPEPVREEHYPLAVVELGRAGAEERIRVLVKRGIPVLAFGSHVDAAVLRAARDAGAHAVPNSQLETELRALL